MTTADGQGGLGPLNALLMLRKCHLLRATATAGYELTLDPAAQEGAQSHIVGQLVDLADWFDARARQEGISFLPWTEELRVHARLQDYRSLLHDDVVAIEHAIDAVIAPLIELEPRPGR